MSQVSNYPFLGSYAITATGATLNAIVNSGSSSATVIFEYGADTTYGTQVAVATAVPINTGGNQNANIAGLTPGTAYHYRVKATNNEGTTLSADATFSTLPVPDVSSQPATYIGATSAIVNGTYNAHGGSYAALFEYGPTTAYGSYVTPYSGGGGGIIIIGGGGGNTPQNTLAVLPSLTASSTYHYRLVLSNSNGNIYYGADATFSTVTPVEAWRSNYFNTAAGTGNADDMASPAGDGIANLVKYAVGMNPTQPGTQPTATLFTDSGTGESYLVLSFNRLLAATDLTYEAQAADNPAGPWTTVAGAAGTAAFSGPGLVSEITPIIFQIPGNYPTATSQVQIRDPVTTSQAARRYMRLKVTR